MEVYVLEDYYHEKFLVFSPDNIEQKVMDYIKQYINFEDCDQEDMDDEFQNLFKNVHDIAFWDYGDLNFAFFKREVI